MVRRRNVSRRDHLRFLGITHRTRRSYEKAVAAFFEYIRALRGRLPHTMLQLDDDLAEYINHLFQEGDSVSFAGWVLSGLKRFYPRCRPHLQTSQLYLRNWQRVHLPCRATPLSWLGAKAVAAAAARVNRFDLALLVLLGFAFFYGQWSSLRSVYLTHAFFPTKELWSSLLSIRKPQRACNNPFPCTSPFWFKFFNSFGTG